MTSSAAVFKSGRGGFALLFPFALLGLISPPATRCSIRWELNEDCHLLASNKYNANPNHVGPQPPGLQARVVVHPFPC
jgi:hypothetical protein